MRSSAKLWLFTSELSPPQLSRLQRIYSSCVQGGLILVVLPFDDPRMTDILSELHDAGFVAWNATGERQQCREYALSLVRQYSPEELSSFPLLEVAPTGSGWVDGGTPRADSPDTVIYEAPTMDIALVSGGYCYVASARVYKALLSGGFADLIWRLAKMRPAGIPPDERRTDYLKKIDPPKRGPWRALRSELVLPRLAPDMPLFHTDHSPFTGDFAKGCWRRDGLYTHAELRYRAEDLEAFGPFDLAHTYEMFGNLPREHDRPLVASQRFYQYCIKHGIETSWQPVRVEE